MEGHMKHLSRLHLADRYDIAFFSVALFALVIL